MARHAAASARRVGAVLLVLSVAAFAPSAAAVKISVTTLNETMVTTLGKLKRNTLAVTSLLVPAVANCELSAQIQPKDTCATMTCAATHPPAPWPWLCCAP